MCYDQDLRPAAELGRAPTEGAAADKAAENGTKGHHLCGGTGVFIPLSGASTVAKGRHNKARAAASRALAAPAAAAAAAAPGGRPRRFSFDSAAYDAHPQRRAAFNFGPAPAFAPRLGALDEAAPARLPPAQPHASPPPGLFLPPPPRGGGGFASGTLSPTQYGPSLSSPQLACVYSDGHLTGPVLPLGQEGGFASAGAALLPLDCSGPQFGCGAFDLRRGPRFAGGPAPAQSYGPPAGGAQAAAAASAASAALQAASAALAVAQRAAAAAVSAPDAGAQVEAASELLRRAQLLQASITSGPACQPPQPHAYPADGCAAADAAPAWEQLQLLASRESSGSLSAVQLPSGFDMAGGFAPFEAMHSCFDAPPAPARQGGGGRGYESAPLGGRGELVLLPMPPAESGAAIGSFSLWEPPGAGAAAAAGRLGARGGEAGGSPPLGSPQFAALCSGEDFDGPISLEQFVALRELSALLTTGMPQ
ncbi:hypothetical protein Rsub_02194 [Raphidocelis subcapitata]|uniref:Uncharacterized protein n=1 Tax=Raphidocelis subcapitata TaxID=307507 RepID=A0A2V0NWK1_9CHLO|nr:hypothetical protein Rsub_02194 [Raphidocelis subcapitata]|eukprot:GBF89317.1 hypothetical protein Rsub_02194 [Raphidocelis subcapitata]